MEVDLGGEQVDVGGKESGGGSRRKNNSDGDMKERSAAAAVHAVEEDVEGETHRQWMALCWRWTGDGAVRVWQWDRGSGWQSSSGTVKRFDEGSVIWGFQPFVS